MPKACLNTGNGKVRNTCYQGERASKRPEGRERSSEGRVGEMGQAANGPERSLRRLVCVLGGGGAAGGF